MLRQLGYWETAKILKHNLLAGHDNLVLSVQMTTELDQRAFTAALEALYNHHVLLRCCVKEHIRWFSFYKRVAFDEVDIGWKKAQNETEVQGFLEKDMQNPFNHALWRVQIFQLPNKATAVCLSICHAIVDIVNAIELLNTLFKTYDLILGGNKPNLKSLPDKPPIEAFQLHRIPREQWFYEQTFDVQHNLAFEKPTLPDQRIPHCYRIPLSLDLFHAIDTICQRVHIPLQALLTSQAMLALQDVFPHKKQVSYSSLMDMRRAATPPIPEETLGHYTVDVIQQSTLKPHNIWEMTMEYHRGLRQAMPELTKFPAGRWNPDHVLNTVHMEQLHEGQYPLVDLSFENLTDLPLKLDYKHFSLCDFDLAMNAIGGMSFISLTLTQARKCLHLNCHYVEPLVSPKTITTYSDALLKRLEEWAHEHNQPH